MTTLRQTVTTVQTNSSTVPAALDNSLDALLEDLQTSVSRPSSAMNGLTHSPVSHSYREVRTAHQEVIAPDNYHVEYMSAANPTTVVSERAISPSRMQVQPGEERSIAYKQVAYQYNTRKRQPGVVEGSSITDPASDARLRQNLNELDNLLVDLHHAQKTGFTTDQVNSPSGGTAGSKSGVDSKLLEDMSSISTARPGQHVSRVVEQHTYTTRYTDQPDSPRLHPKRSSSAQRELTYGTIEPQQGSGSPRTSRRTVSRDVYQDSKTSTSPHSQYRDKSPSNQRLHREMYYESNKTSRIREPSPPAPKRGMSPGPVEGYPGSKITSVRTYSSTTPTEHYPVSKHTTVHTYTDSPVPLDNYSTTKSLSNTRTYTGESPPTFDNSYPSTKVTTVRTYTGDSSTLDNYPPPSRVRESPVPADTYQGTKTTTVRTYTNIIPGGRPASPTAELPKATPPYRSPSPVQFHTPQPKITTTVRTYTYEPQPGDIPDHPGMYQSPQPEREPLIGTPEPTIITYKYSSHSSHHTNTKFPTGSPEDREPLLPRPFPPASPGPGDSHPPKRLDELMASFSDTEVDERRPLPAPTYHVTERQASTPRNVPPGSMTTQNSEVAVVTPTPTKSTAAAMEKQVEQRRGQTKNVAGPAVYYPPGVEMFARKDQSMQMASMKGSGKYEMSRESHSKSSSGGAAVVPVCLPLCCAMPCVIM